MHQSFTSSSALRGLLYLGGTVASAAGVHTAIAGAKSIPGRAETADPVIESELRFYGMFYAAYGVAMLDTARRGDVGGRDFAVFAGALFAAGLARAGAWRAVGRPSSQQVGLLVVELAVPPLLGAWRAALATRHGQAYDPGLVPG